VDQLEMRVKRVRLVFRRAADRVVGFSLTLTPAPSQASDPFNSYHDTQQPTKIASSIDAESNVPAHLIPIPMHCELSDSVESVEVEEEGSRDMSE